MAAVQLDTSDLNLGLLINLTKGKLIHILEDTCPEIKDLVIEDELIKPIGRIVSLTTIKKHGVQRIFNFEAHMPDGSNQRLYIIRPTVEKIKLIIGHYKYDIEHSIKRNLTIIAVPSMPYICSNFLESEGMINLINFEPLFFALLPLENDMLTMTNPSFFADYFIHGDYCFLRDISEAIMMLQRLYGKIHTICGIGKCSKAVFETIDHFPSKPYSTSDPHRHDINKLILFDRTIDMVTPLLSQLIYEGLLDEVFGIECGKVDSKSDVAGQTDAIRLDATSQDPIYNEIRSRHFSNVFSFVSLKIKELNGLYEKKSSLRSVSDLKQFIGKDLRRFKEDQKHLTTHLGACEAIMKVKGNIDFEEILIVEHKLLNGSELKSNLANIEDEIAKQSNFADCARLLCLASLTNNGLAQKDLKELYLNYLQSFGFDLAPKLLNAQKLDLFTDKTKAGAVNFPKISRKLGLLTKDPELVDLKNPTDPSYAFNGVYTPLSIRLIEKAMGRNGFESLSEVLKLVDAPVFEKRRCQCQPRGLGGNVIVFFLGGCTQTEINLLRFIGKVRDFRIIVITTATITNLTFIKSVMEA